MAGLSKEAELLGAMHIGSVPYTPSPTVDFRANDKSYLPLLVSASCFHAVSPSKTNNGHRPCFRTLLILIDASKLGHASNSSLL
eukprot:scaffold11996_cov73-Cyclotella_meneghiniana.AAC.1